jgi:hypothetical protein
MGVQRGAGQETGAHQAEAKKADEDEEMPEVRDAWRGRWLLGQGPGLEERRLGWNELVRINWRRLGFPVLHPFRRNRREGWRVRNLWPAGITFGDGALRA